jgi:hypothetical protein
MDDGSLIGALTFPPWLRFELISALQRADLTIAAVLLALKLAASLELESQESCATQRGYDI